MFVVSMCLKRKNKRRQHVCICRMFAKRAAAASLSQAVKKGPRPRPWRDRRLRADAGMVLYWISVHPCMHVYVWGGPLA